MIYYDFCASFYLEVYSEVDRVYLSSISLFWLRLAIALWIGSAMCFVTIIRAAGLVREID